jgi:hypothetical protein
MHAQHGHRTFKKYDTNTKVKNYFIYRKNAEIFLKKIKGRRSQKKRRRTPKNEIMREIVPQNQYQIYRYFKYLYSSSTLFFCIFLRLIFNVGNFFTIFYFYFTEIFVINFFIFPFFIFLFSKPQHITLFLHI